MSDRPPTFARARTMLAAAAASTAVLVATGAGLAAPGAPPGTARDLAQTYFSNTLTRAEVVSVVGRAVQDYRIDAGRVTGIRPNAIDLRECDGTRQTIAVGRRTQIVSSALARGTRVVAVRNGDGPATQIRPAGSARVLGKTFFGPTFVRAEVLNCSGKAVHDYRIDEGRIVSVHPGASITLLERDATRQSVTVNSSTLVTETGQPVDLSSVTQGMSAIVIREGDGPALEIRLFPGFLTGRR